MLKVAIVMPQCIATQKYYMVKSVPENNGVILVLLLILKYYAILYSHITIYSKTFECKNFRGSAQNTLFTGKLSRCIRPWPSCTVHSK